jgi:hypothetical protein
MCKGCSTCDIPTAVAIVRFLRVGEVRGPVSPRGDTDHGCSEFYYLDYILTTSNSTLGAKRYANPTKSSLLKCSFDTVASFNR